MNRYAVPTRSSAVTSARAGAREPRRVSLYLSLLAGACILAGVVAACQGTMANQGGMRAELDVFSGRPNPKWELTAGESTEFASRLGALPPVSGRTVRDTLGYRGIVITLPGGTVGGFESVVLSGGVVLGRRPGGDQTFVDRDRALERWVFQTSRGRVDEEVRKVVSPDLGLAP